MDIQNKIEELEAYFDLIKIGFREIKIELDQKKLSKQKQPKKKSTILSNRQLAKILARRQQHRNN